MVTAKAKLLRLSPDLIKSNPENPRLIFREDEMQILRDSIRTVGIKVPLTVYQADSDTEKYIILDGERRWRCARKLNLPDVPVIVQPKPSKLENLLTMFNIHNVRVDWDVIATALKLGEVRALLEAEGKPNEIKDLAGLTGLSKPMVRNCLELLELPEKYRSMLLEEAQKPKKDQRITPDLFIEIYKSQRVVADHMPEVFDAVTPRSYVDVLVNKYQQDVIKSVVSFRDISKIARGENAGAEREDLIPIVVDLIKDKTYTIEEAYEDSVKNVYELRDLTSRADSLLDRLAAFKKARLSPEVRSTLQRLRERLNELLGDK